jgi:phage terminase large subunit-like protein
VDRPAGPVHRWSDADRERLCREGIPRYDPWRNAAPRYRFDVRLARRVVAFFAEMLVFVEGEKAGQPFLLEPWQAAIVGNLFGWVDSATGLRRYREALVFVARKNGKTPLAAGVALYVLFCDGEYGGQVYSAAAEQSQAALIFRHATAMIERSRALLARCRVYRAFKSVEVPATNSIFRALSADAHTKHGLNASAALVDELHAHPTRDLLDVLQTSMGSRRQPVLFEITTSDFERPSICNEKHAYASRVRDGVFEDPSFLPVIYEASPKDDFADAAVWRKANPNLGVSVKEDYLVRECARAKESPAYLNTFLRLHLNVRTNADVAWLDAAAWDRCAGALAFRALEKAMLGKTCYAGLDLASTDDLNAFVLLFPEDGNVVLPWFWCPAENAVTREKRHRVPYTQWARDGFLTLTDGNSADKDLIERRILELAKLYTIKGLAYDRFGADQIKNHLVAEHIDVVSFGQGFVSMNAPTKEIDVLVRSGRLRHGGHPVLKWMASNVMLKKDEADNWKPDKKRSREKIDGIVALVMAEGLALARPASRTSVYDTPGYTPSSPFTSGSA